MATTEDPAVLCLGWGGGPAFGGLGASASASASASAVQDFAACLAAWPPCPVVPVCHFIAAAVTSDIENHHTTHLRPAAIVLLKKSALVHSGCSLLLQPGSDFWPPRQWPVIIASCCVTGVLRRHPRSQGHDIGHQDDQRPLLLPRRSAEARSRRRPIQTAPGQNIQCHTNAARHPLLAQQTMSTPPRQHSLPGLHRAFCEIEMVRLRQWSGLLGADRMRHSML